MVLLRAIRLPGILAAALAGFVLLEISADAAEVYIQLKETAVVNTNQVLVSSIATVECSDPIQKQQAESIDVKVLDLALPEETVSSNLVKIRLAVAGFPYDQLHMSGADETIVVFQPPQTLTDLQVEDQALLVLCQSLHTERENLKVLLQGSFIQSLPKILRETEDLELKVLPPTHRSLGAVTLTVQVWKAGKLEHSRSVAFDVRRRHRVAVARVSLTRETPINESNVQFENRFLTTEVDELEPPQLMGRTVRGTVIAGSIVQIRDLQLDAHSSSDLKIKKGDTVQVIAVAARLRTVIRNAEALEDGRLGGRIRMMNRDSGKEVVGEVLGPGQAIVHIK